MYTGPHIIKDNLVFGYDTGYGIADNDTATRFYPGGPTVNYVTDASLLQNGWGGSYSLIDSATKSFQFNVSSFNGSAGSGQGWRSFMWDMRSHAGSAVTISATIEVPSDSPGNFAWVMMGQANSRADGTTTATYLGYSASSERVQKTTKTKERITWSGTIGNTGTANQPNGIIGFTVWYNGGTNGTNHFIKVSNVQIEKVAHETPFVNGTRSSTASLIDLKETTDIDVSNVSFDSTGQPIFDGTNDYLQLNAKFLPTIGAFTMEFLYQISTTGGRGGMFERNPSSPYNGALIGQGGAGSWYFQVTNGSQSLTIDDMGYPSTNTWYYDVGVYDGVNTIKFYRNGSLHDTVTGSTIGSIDSGGSRDNMRFMKRDNTSNTIGGKVAISKVHNKALSDAEVKQNYNAYKNRFNI